MASINRQVALLLCRAQVASDGGKGGLFGCPAWDDNSLAARDFRAGYPRKDECIAEAMALISLYKSAFSFYIAEGDEKAPHLIYFNFKIDGERRQISFHSFGNWRGLSYAKTRHKTRWHSRIGSGRTAMDLVEVYGLDYKIY